MRGVVSEDAGLGGWVGWSCVHVLSTRENGKRLFSGVLAMGDSLVFFGDETCIKVGGAAASCEVPRLLFKRFLN